MPCKDTPNFIANRIGSFFGGTIAKIAVEGDYTVEEVDAITGPLIGLPNSASFRLLDIVGLDVWAFVGTNLYHAVPEDPWRDRFLMTDSQKKMIERGWLGEKSGQGFYKRVGKEKEIHAIDLKTLEYHPAAKVKFPSAEAARNIEDLGERLRTLVKGARDRVGTFLWKLFSDLFLYSAEMSARDFRSHRRNRSRHALGLRAQAGAVRAVGRAGIRRCVQAAGSGQARDSRERSEDARTRREIAVSLRRFGRQARHRIFRFLAQTTYQQLEDTPGIAGALRYQARAGRGEAKRGRVADRSGRRRAVRRVPQQDERARRRSVSACLYAGLEETEKNFDAMVIANQGENFSVGANLMLVLLAAQEGEWDELNAAMHRFQQVNMALKYAAKPVVAAPFARSLGGGCEIPLHCARVQASAETYMGLVEVGVGLIPAGGGCKELLLRLDDPRRVFELIGYGEGFVAAREEARVARIPARLRSDFDESGPADRRRQGAGAVAGARLCSRERRARISKSAARAPSRC